MIPHTQTQDVKPADLAAQITAASTPPQITAAAASITTFILTHDHHHHRRFFSLTFPTLISRLLGFDHNPPRGWISSSDPSLSSTLLSLLSPTSPLFNSISAVDRLSLVKYVFPIERLPPWAHLLLLSKHNSNNNKNSSSSLLLSPLFKNRVHLINGLNQIELNVFEYFMFWFAYYPLSNTNTNTKGSKGSVITHQNPKKRLENWAHSLPRFPTSKKANEKKAEYGLYTRLLYAYMREYVPMYDLGSQPYRSSLLHYSSSFDSSVSDRAEFFVNTLIQFWLVDNDFSPVPVNVCKSFGVNINLRVLIGENPPSPGLGEVVGMFVKYVSLSSVADQVECCNVMDNVNLLVQRPLYRYILRTFLFCPMESSMKNVSHVFSVWMSYIQPWAVGLSDFKGLEADIEKPGKSRKEVVFGFREPSGYSSLWQGFVLSNYLFFSSLVMHFIGFAHKFLHADPEAIVKMVSKVMDVLTSCTELTDLIKNVDTVFHAIPLRSSKSVLNSLQKFVPSIREQLQDWEDGLCESDADGSFLHDNWNKDLRLFCQSENGGQQLLQLFVLRAGSELQAISSDNANLQCLNSIRKQTGCLFGGSLVKPVPISFEERQFQDPRHEIFRPRRICNGKSTDIKYKGDWMKRPISNDEVAWLAKLMVSLSCWLNGLLGLNQDQNADVGPGLSYVDVSDDVLSVSGSDELAKVISHAVASFFVGLFRILVWCMKKYGLRVNLRVLASKKVLTVFIVAFGLNLLIKYIAGA